MSGPKPPKPTPQERALQDAQRQLLEQQRELLIQQREERRIDRERFDRLAPIQEELLRGQLEAEKRAAARAQSTEEREDRYYQQQLELAERQTEGQRRQELLQEELYRLAGLDAVRDESGKITGYKKTRQTTDEQLQEQFLTFQRAQLERQTEQDRLQDILYPSLLESQGYKLLRDDKGKVVGVELTEEAKQDKAIKGQLRERQAKALRGELDIDPALTKQLTDEEQTLRESLRKQLGGDYATSSAGIEALGQFQERKSRVLEGARRGEITLNEQLSLAREGEERARTQSAAALGQLNLRETLGGGVTGRDTLAALYGGGRSIAAQTQPGRRAATGIPAQAFQAPGNVATFGEVFGGGDDLITGLQQQRANDYRKRLADFQRKQQLYSAIGTTAGAIVGTALGGNTQAGAAVGGLIGYGSSYL